MRHPSASRAPTPQSTRMCSDRCFSPFYAGTRYAHANALRFDTVTPPMLSMRKVVSEDSARRKLKKLDQIGARRWQGKHLRATWERLLRHPWMLDIDTTVKTVFGRLDRAPALVLGCRGAPRQPKFRMPRHARAVGTHRLAARRMRSPRHSVFVQAVPNVQGQYIVLAALSPAKRPRWSPFTSNEAMPKPPLTNSKTSGAGPGSPHKTSTVAR